MWVELVAVFGLLFAIFALAFAIYIFVEMRPRPPPQPEFYVVSAVTPINYNLPAVTTDTSPNYINYSNQIITPRNPALTLSATDNGIIFTAPTPGTYFISATLGITGIQFDVRGNTAILAIMYGSMSNPRDSPFNQELIIVNAAPNQVYTLTVTGIINLRQNDTYRIALLNDVAVQVLPENSRLLSWMIE